jgi:hypothetical protein
MGRLSTVNRRLILACFTLVGISLTNAKTNLGLPVLERSCRNSSGQEAVTPEQRFRSRDASIQSAFNEVVRQKHHGFLSMKQYSASVKKLRKKELKLFSDVRKHEFNDIAEANYWHRSRLKFPSTLALETQWLKHRKGRCRARRWISDLRDSTRHETYLFSLLMREAKQRSTSTLKVGAR